jgi:hypothetical protein
VKVARAEFADLSDHQAVRNDGCADNPSIAARRDDWAHGVEGCSENNITAADTAFGYHEALARPAGDFPHVLAAGDRRALAMRPRVCCWTSPRPGCPPTKTL